MHDGAGWTSTDAGAGGVPVSADRPGTDRTGEPAMAEVLLSARAGIGTPR